MGNAGLLTFFGNTDLTTAKHISERLGDTEVIRTVMNASENWQRSAGESRSRFPRGARRANARHGQRGR